ncbi:MAG: AAA family ATPase [Candidatus Binatia bacterium]
MVETRFIHGAQAEVGATTPGEPFIGRTQELDELESYVRDSAGRLVLVTGAPGIGKTRLMNEFAARAALAGRRVLKGGCWEGEGAPAFWPFVLVLRHYLAAAEDASAGAAACADLHELLDRALRTEPRWRPRQRAPAAADAQQAQFELFDRFASFVAELSVAQPAAILLDDIHWADTSSMLLLQFLASRLAELRVLLLVTSREPVPAPVSATCRHPSSRQMPLAGLNATEVRALLQAAGIPVSREALVDKLVALTDGNPFFLKELARLAEASDAPPGPDWPAPLPATLRALTLHQFASLSPACRNMLCVAAVIGRDFEAELVAEALHQPIDAVLDLLHEALATRVLTALGPGKYRFAHALVRETLYEDLPLSERARLHERIALALRKRDTSRPTPISALAHHFFLALPLSDHATAAAYARKAGAEAYRACAYDEAVIYLRRAHELGYGSSSPEQLCDLLMLLGTAEAAAGAWQRSRDTFAECMGIARSINDPSRFCHAAIGFKGMMLATIPIDTEVVAILEEARDRAQKDDILLAEVLSALAGALYFHNDPSLPIDYSSRALELATRTGDDHLRATALQARIVSLWRPGQVRHVLALSSELLSMSQRLGDPHFAFQARIARHSALLFLGAIQESDLELAEMAHIAHKNQHPRLQWQVAVIRAARAIARGQTHLIEQLCSATRSLGQRVHDPSATHYELIQAYQRSLLDGDLRHWEPMAASIVDAFPTIVGYRAAKALLHARLGQLDAARSILEPFVAVNYANIPSNSVSLWLLSMLSEATALCREADWAASLYNHLLPYAANHIVVGWGILLDGSVSHYLGVLAVTVGDFRSAHHHFQQAIVQNTALLAPPLVARSQLSYAELLTHASQDSDRGRELARTAETTFQNHGLNRYADRARAISAQRSPALKSSMNAQLSSVPADRRDPQDPEANVLRRQGDVWLLTFRGQSTYVRDSLGIAYIAQIIGAAGREIHVLDLIATRSAATPHGTSHGLLIDAQARTEYRRRLREIYAELDVANSHHDLGMVTKLQAEQDAISRELGRALGLGGRSRPALSDSERARVSVRNRITTALRAIRPKNQAAYSHLLRCLRTGTWCAYEPETHVPWRLD